MNTDIVPETLERIPTSDITDDLELREALAFIEDDDKAMLFLWLAGYTQTQIAGAFRIGQKTVSRHIRAMLDSGRY